MSDNGHLTAEQLRARAAYYDVKLREAAINFYADLGLMDPRDLRADMEGFGWTSPTTPPPINYRSQKRGEVIPVYLNEESLHRIRDRSRRLAVENEFAICALENRQNYVVGEGITYRAAPLPGCPAKLPAQCQQVIDLFSEANELPELEADSLMRYDRDGEFFLRTFEREDGLLLVRTIEPEHVRAPTGSSYDDRHSFGVETEPGDVESPVGYWVIEDPVRAPTPHFVPASDILHVKANTPRNAKRGLPTFYPIESNLRRAEDLLASMTSLAKTRAKIAIIRKYNSVLKSTAQTMLDSLTDATATDPATGQTMNTERWRYGTILNSSGNIDYEFPSGDVQAGDYVTVLEAEIRSVAARLVMPSWMLLTSATDANYASALVAEAPSTKMFGRLQRLWSRRFGTGRIPGPKLSLLWRQLRFCVRLGILPPETLRCIEIQAEGPSLIVRDHNAEATTNKTYFEMKVKSRQTIRQEIGLDDQTEEQNFATDPEEQAQQQAQQQQMLGATQGLQPPGGVQPDLDRPKGLGESAGWDANSHPRGQPDNAGQFAAGAASGSPGEDRPGPSSPQSAHSKARVMTHGATDPKQVDAVLAKLFSAKDASVYRQLASVIGAPDDASVIIKSSGPYQKRYDDDYAIKAEGVRVEVKHAKLGTTSYFVGIDAKGNKFIRVEIFGVKSEHQKSGLGMHIFGQQVEHAAARGFAYISLHAAGGPGEAMNGYYTWPRFGFDQSMQRTLKTRGGKKLTARILAQFPEAESIQDIMKTPEGRDWWKANGSDLMDARFDLSEGSLSKDIFDAYQTERAQRGGKTHAQ